MTYSFQLMKPFRSTTTSLATSSMALHVIIDSNYNNDGGWVTNYLLKPLRHLQHLYQQDTPLLVNHHLYLLHLLDIGDHLLVPYNLLHIAVTLPAFSMMLVT